MLTIAKCRDLAYYEREVIDGREDYLSESGTSPGRWVGSLAAGDGLSGPADRTDLAAAFSGLHPSGSEMTAYETTVTGYDLTLSPSKSVSLVWALGSEHDAHEVEEALYAARDEVERYLETTACFVRRGHAGVVVAPGSGFLGAVFRHRTSRLGDPGIHLHWTVFNVTEGPDGVRTALDGRALYRERYTAEAVFQATLRRELVARLGLVFDEMDRHGVAEVVGVSGDMRRAFSRRRAEIVAEMERVGVRSGAGARVANLKTRKAKPVGISEAELRAEWRQRAGDLRFDLSGVPRVARTPQLRVSDDELTMLATEENATFTRSDAVRRVAKAARQGASLDEILARAEGFLDSDRTVAVATGRWTTPEMLALETRVVAMAERPGTEALRAQPAEHRFEAVRPELEGQATARNPVTPDDYRARSVLFVPDAARLSGLVDLPEGKDLGAAVDAAMKAVEADNPELRDVLPRGYQRLERSTLTELLRLFSPLPRKLSGDAFGLIYEDFLSNFAMAEGRLGGEFFTPYSIVRLIVEIIEPFHGKVYDPACGSGGMFVQCAKFVERHAGSATRELSVYGQEQKEVTVPLAKMNLALHGLSGDIRLGNSYYDDLHDAVGRFDFVMANPPFNVNGVDKGKLAGDTRFPFGLPKTDNGNYLWIQQFCSALNDGGRAGFVMANSAGDAGHSEKEIRRQLIESGAVDVMVAIGTNFFYTVTLPVTLWFLDRGKAGTDREDTVLFIDARRIHRQIDRAHRDFLPEQIELLASIVRLYRGENVAAVDGSDAALKEHFPDGTYVDVPGLCKVVTRAEIQAQGWSLNPGRYTGTAAVDDDGEDFAEKLEGFYEEFTRLSDEADALRSKVDVAVTGILSA